MALSIEDISVFCKKKGFVYPSSEIYGGVSGFFDFGPLGVELFNNIKQSFWKFFVQSRDDMVGIEASIISHPRTWKASGHLESFGDLVLTCTKCKEKVRADHFIEDTLKKPADGMKAEEINGLIVKHGLKCPKCKSTFEELDSFNLLFETSIGAKGDSAGTAYLRGETAQGMFLDFKQVAESARLKLPFGIAQIGRCFRNEISPRDFLFRSREFHIGEFEYFIHPKDKKCLILTDAEKELSVPFLDEDTQDQGKDILKDTTIGDMLKSKKLGEYHAYWLAKQVEWLVSLGLELNNLKIREHTKNELSHYSSATFDVDYSFPFGSKEIAGNANRGQYDLNQHILESKKKLSIFDEESKEQVVPRVIEPTFGMERVFLAVLCDAYSERKDEKGNSVVVLKLKPELAPVKVGIFPLQNDSSIVGLAQEIHEMLQKLFVCQYDRSGSIGRRYARADEIGVPYCITVDFDSMADQSVTIRDRDSTKQTRVKIGELREKLLQLLNGETEDDIYGN